MIGIFGRGGGRMVAAGRALFVCGIVEWWL